MHENATTIVNDSPAAPVASGTFEQDRAEQTE